MKRKIVIYSRFNDNDSNLAKGFKIDSYSKEWIDNRMKIFNQYTRVSFENQTNQDFLAVLRMHPDTQELVEAALKQYAPLKENIIFTAHPNKLIAEYAYDAEELYLASIDSDDMYRADFIQTLYDTQPKKETSVLICQKGYILEQHTGILAHYFNKGPSVFTQIFKVEDYLDVYQYFPEFNHGLVGLVPNQPIQENMFIIVAHGDNTYTTANPYYRNAITNEKEKRDILSQFKL